MVRFKYKISNDLNTLIHDTIVDYDDDYLYGIMDEGDMGQLQHRGLFLICEDNIINGESIYMNPLVVVAKNTFNAVEMYCTEFDKDSAFSMAELEHRCDKLKVEPV